MLHVPSHLLAVLGLRHFLMQQLQLLQDALILALGSRRGLALAPQGALHGAHKRLPLDLLIDLFFH